MNELGNFLAVFSFFILVFCSVGLYISGAYIYVFVSKAQSAKAKIICEWELTREIYDHSNYSKLGWVASLAKNLAKIFGFSKNLLGLFITVKYNDGQIGNLKISKKLYCKIQKLRFIEDGNLHSFYFKTGRWTQQRYAVSIQ